MSKLMPPKGLIPKELIPKELILKKSILLNISQNSYGTDGYRSQRGVAVLDVILLAAIIVFAIIPVFCYVIESYSISVKAQIIRDAVDMTNISAYEAIIAENLSGNILEIDYEKMQSTYRGLLAKNLSLYGDMSPKPESIADEKVLIESLLVYNEGAGATCLNGSMLDRPSIHACIIVPVKPSLYRQFILEQAGKSYFELKIHVDSEIPIDN
ncbi:MAG TPA: hypothetical protein GXX36_15985 [Clostridiaceae bacterium]|nr:hypothetical protein [Clostridiaceae bacterium]